ncbi:hypothetical protein [Hyphococcus sp.]|uniref:hypothetical protein n=1 Tax=Hyphococcus sp. TaxID=2038636 RepID=UPI003CCBD267
MKTLITKLSCAGIAAALATTSAGAFFLERESDRAKEMLSQYERTGETVSCLSLRRVDDTDAVDDFTLLVEARGGDLYLNELNGRCIGLEREQRYVRKSTQAQMCRGDIIQVVDNSGISFGSCGLGEFEKLSKIETPVSQ